jgi:hypothetical protein
MESKDYLQDIHEIKHLMNRSSRFMSLSGMSGILAGIYALIGAYIAHGIINTIRLEQNPLKRFFIAYDSVGTLLIIAILVMILSISTGVYLTSKKAKKQNDKIFDKSSKRLLINFLIPLLTGGVYCLFLIENEYFNLIASTLLNLLDMAYSFGL